MSDGEESRFKLRWRKIDTVLEAGVKELRVTRRIAVLSGIQIEDRRR